MALIIIGIIVIADLGRFSNYLSGSITAPPILFLVLGIFVIGTSIFGFYCIEKQNIYFLIVVGISIYNVLNYT